MEHVLLGKRKNISKENERQMEHLETLDFSRESTETIAPFLTIVGVDSTFISAFRIK